MSNEDKLQSLNQSLLIVESDQGGPLRLLGKPGYGVKSFNVAQDRFHTTSFRMAYVENGATTALAVPGTTTSLTASNLLRIDDIPANTRRITFKGGHAADNTNGMNIIGWLVALQAGSQSDAATWLARALDESNGHLMKYASGSSANVSPNGDIGVVFVPTTGLPDPIDLDEDVTTIYLVPIGLATTAAGTCILSVGLGVPND